MAQQVIESDRLGGQIHKGVVRRNQVKNDLLKNKIGKYLMHGVRMVAVVIMMITC